MSFLIIDGYYSLGLWPSFWLPEKLAGFEYFIGKYFLELMLHSYKMCGTDIVSQSRR